MDVVPNIEKLQKVELIAWGVLLLLGVFLGRPGFISFIVGAGLVAQGILGFSVVPYLINKFNIKL